MTFATSAAVAGTIAVAVFAGPLWDMSEEIARDLLDGSTYIDLVNDAATDVVAVGEEGS